MFAGLEAVQQHPMRRWTTMLSFTLQASLVALALALPLYRPGALSEVAFHRYPIFTPVSEPDIPVSGAQQTGQTGAFVPVAPIVVSRGAVHFPGMRPVATGPGPGPYVPQLRFENTGTSALNSVLNTPAGPAPHGPATAQLRTSVVMTGNLIRRVEPLYPAIARQVGVQGTVLIRALINRDGDIEHVQVVSGSPLLARAALDAVQQWKYRPYYLNGQPIEVETEITVNFVLGR